MSKIVTFVNRARKAVTALSVGVAGWATAVAESAPAGITNTEWIALGTVVLAALGVYKVANKPA